MKISIQFEELKRHPTLVSKTQKQRIATKLQEIQAVKREGSYVKVINAVEAEIYAELAKLEATLNG